MIVEYETECRAAVNDMAQPAALGIWTMLMAGAMVIPAVAGSSSPGDNRLRFAIHLALLFYFAACTCMLLASSAEWQSGGTNLRTARMLWSLAWLSYAVHVLLSFQHFHHWSHAHAIAHTREVSGFGEGIFVTHIFTLLWAADAATWWLNCDQYVRRPSWLGWTIHGFMAFIVFNGSVVYASGAVRWASAAGFVWLAALIAYKHVGSHSKSVVASEGLHS